MSAGALFYYAEQCVRHHVVTAHIRHYLMLISAAADAVMLPLRADAC